MGKFLDPAADKALMLAAFLALSFIDAIPLWLAVVVIGRDVLIGGTVVIGMARHRHVDTTPLFIGKLTTALQITYLGAHLAALAFTFSLGAAVPTDAYILAALTIVSGLAYAQRWLAGMRAGAPA